MSTYDLVMQQTREDDPDFDLTPPGKMFIKNLCDHIDNRMDDFAMELFRLKHGEDAE